ncbi:hypothetical protein FGB62_330g09 [Gracilaria domingensis]|nr:hypothetical protein FGB62_330g09 [Gracilaria domingensis]
MEDTKGSLKRKLPDEPENPQQAVSKRRREHASEDFDHEPDDAAKQNMEFLSQPQVKEDLLEEALLLEIPATFEEDDPDLVDNGNLTNSQADASSDADVDQLTQPEVEVIDVDSQENNPSSNQNMAAAEPQPLVPYRPILWGLQQANTDEHLQQLLASAEEHHESAEAFQNRSWIHSSDEQQQGSLWSQVRQEQLQSLLIDPRYVLRSPQVERDDFLKAYMRLHHFAHPDRLSDLLGRVSRPKKYCEFLLNFMLDLYNTKEVATKIGRKRCFVKYPGLAVYHDGYYADNDTIVRRLDVLQEKKKQFVEAEGSASPGRKGDTYQEELIQLVEDRLVDESDEEEPDVTDHKSQRLQLQDGEMDQLCDFASYILRSYMYNVSGETFYNADQFGKYCQQQGMSFLNSEQADVEYDRLKWLDEPVLAPSLGSGKAIKEPLQLWHHAINTFSVKNLARCALIQSDSLLDWLEYVTRMKNNPNSLEEFYASERPVVCFAPVALLYLADTAVAFALEVIRAAIISVERDELFEEKQQKAYEEMKELDDDETESKPAETEEPSKESSTRIERIHVHRAARCKFKNNLQGSSFFLNQILQAEPLPDGSLNPRWFEAEWPQRKVRPYTASTEFEICSRSPPVKVTIPHNAMIETRAILMGINSPYHMSLYTKGSSSTGVPKRLQKSITGERLEVTKVANKTEQKEKADGDDQMKDEAGKGVRKKNNILPPPRTDLAPSGKGKLLSKPTEDTTIHNANVVENIGNRNQEKHFREGGNEPQCSNGDVLAKENAIAESGQVDAPVPKLMNTSFENLRRTPLRDAPGNSKETNHQGEESELEKTREENTFKNMENETKPATDITIDTDAKNVSGDDIKRQKVMELHCQNLDKTMGRKPAPELVQNEEEVITNDNTSELESKRRKKYAKFFGVPNPAEAIIASVGLQEWRNISLKDVKTTLARMKGEPAPDDRGVSTEEGAQGDLLRHRASSICYNRLRWIVLHALGIRAEEKVSSERPLDYASTAHYANFRQFRSKKPLAISDGTFFLLAQLTEQFVRHEAEILMDCAAHDDGRPWIDLADVALVHAVRKKDFPYNNF